MILPVGATEKSLQTETGGSVNGWHPSRKDARIESHAFKQQLISLRALRLGESFALWMKTKQHHSCVVAPLAVKGYPEVCISYRGAVEYAGYLRPAGCRI